MKFTRYAIYFTPEPGPLAEFGAAWLGWDPATGRAVPHLEVSALSDMVSRITETPRRYGLHATIKPPFRLADGQDQDTLRAALATYCAACKPVRLDGLEIARMGRFLALVPMGGTAALDAMAAATVRAFEPFRAPPTEEELARRRAGGLTPEQELRLATWGYPYVMDGFRFHITLTGKLPRAQLDQVRTALAPHLDSIIPAPFPIDGLTLAGEDEQGRFHVIDRHSLSG